MTGFCWRRWAKSASRYAVKELSNKMLPRLDQINIHNRGRTCAIPYLYRPGTGGPAVLFVHGLGGAKENREFEEHIATQGAFKIGH